MVDVRTRLAAMLRRRVRSGWAPERAIEVVFGDGSPPTTLGDLTSRIAASPSGFHKDWRRNGLPGTPYNLVERGVLAAAAEMRTRDAKVLRVAVHASLLVLVHACRQSGPTPGHRPNNDIPELPFNEVAAIGGAAAQGAGALGAVRGGTLIPATDLLALIDGMTQTVSYFTGAGVHVRTVGRRGGGPGESQSLRTVWGTPEGGLCTWDARQKRVTELDPDGRVVRVGHIDDRGLHDPFPEFVGFFDDCRYVIRDRSDMMGWGNRPEGLQSDSVRFLLFAPDGVLMDTLASALGAEKWFRNRGGIWAERKPIFGKELMTS